MRDFCRPALYQHVLVDQVYKPRQQRRNGLSSRHQLFGFFRKTYISENLAELLRNLAEEMNKLSE